MISKGFLTEAHDGALKTNAIKMKIDKQEGYMTCKMCKDREGRIAHLTSECSKLTQLEYNKTYDKVAGAVHWSLCESMTAVPAYGSASHNNTNPVDRPSICR